MMKLFMHKNTGRKLTEEHKDKIRKALMRNSNSKGRKLTLEHKTKIGKANSISLKGKKQSKELIEKRIAPLIGRKRPEITGEKHPKWIQDRSLLKRTDKKDTQVYKEWRMSVYKRDNFKCKISNSDCNGRIEAHHILPWRTHIELRYDINNGITLCHFHHPIKKSEEEKLSPYFMELISCH